MAQILTHSYVVAMACGSFCVRGDDHVSKFLHHFHTVRGVQNKKEEKTHVCEIHFELRLFELRQ